MRPVIFTSNLLFEAAAIRSGKRPSTFGDARVTFVDPRDVAQALLAAARETCAVGQVYNATNGSETDTQREWFTILAEELGVPPPRLSVSFHAAYAVALAAEGWARLRGDHQPPRVGTEERQQLAEDPGRARAPSRRRWWSSHRRQSVACGV